MSTFLIREGVETFNGSTLEQMKCPPEQLDTKARRELRDRYTNMRGQVEDPHFQLEAKLEDGFEPELNLYIAFATKDPDNALWRRVAVLKSRFDMTRKTETLLGLETISLHLNVFKWTVADVRSITDLMKEYIAGDPDIYTKQMSGYMTAKFKKG